MDVHSGCNHDACPWDTAAVVLSWAVLLTVLGWALRLAVVGGVR